VGECVQEASLYSIDCIILLSIWRFKDDKFILLSIRGNQICIPPTWMENLAYISEPQIFYYEENYLRILILIIHFLMRFCMAWNLNKWLENKIYKSFPPNNKFGFQVTESNFPYWSTTGTKWLTTSPLRLNAAAEE